MTDVGVLHDWIFPSAPPVYASQEIAAKVLNSTVHCVADSVIGGVPAQCSQAAQQLGATVVEATEKATMEFLPLMMTSLYCSLGIIWAWLRLSWIYMSS